MQREGEVHRHQLALIACATHLVAFSALAAQDAQGAMRQYVATQAQAELMLRASELPRVSAATIRLEQLDIIAEKLDVWRATLPSDHSHPYLLASIQGELVGLGGFSAPGLMRVAPFLTSGSLGEKRIRRAAEQLARLADPNGALQVVLPASADLPSYISTVAVAWSKVRPTDWPPDTVAAGESGGWHVRLTLLSRDTRSFTLHWIPFAFSFEFDRQGQLVAWSSRAGEFFGVPGAPGKRNGAIDRR